MVPSNSASRFSSLSSQVLLAQTDTTVGFLSQNAHQLQSIKSRDSSKPFIKVYPSFESFTSTKRMPKQHKKFIRRAKKTTFIVKNQAYRIAKPLGSSCFFHKTPWFYSTSANKSQEHFQRDFCEFHADIIIKESHGLFEGKASKLYKLNNKKSRRLR